MVHSDWDLAPKCVCGPNFISSLIGESLILSATDVLCVLLLDYKQKCLSRISQGWSSNEFGTLAVWIPNQKKKDLFGHPHKLPGITTGFALGYLS